MQRDCDKMQLGRTDCWRFYSCMLSSGVRASFVRLPMGTMKNILDDDSYVIFHKTHKKPF